MVLGFVCILGAVHIFFFRGAHLLTAHIYRTSSQKPGDELLATFRQQFPEVAAATSASSAGPTKTTTAGQADVAVTSQERCVE